MIEVAQFMAWVVDNIYILAATLLGMIYVVAYLRSRGKLCHCGKRFDGLVTSAGKKFKRCEGGHMEMIESE